MANVFETIAFIRKLREKYPDEDIYIEKSNGKRIVAHPKEDVFALEGYVVICKPTRDIGIETDHIISILNKGDL